MKKRALSWLLALTMLLTLAPQTLPVWASATGETSNTATQTESKLSANTYSALGLSRNVADSEKPKDQPYGKAEVGNTIATNVINELYVNFNGSIHYGWSILDNLTMQYKDGEGIDWTSSDNFYGAMGYWRPNQQPVHYGTGNKKEGALFATNKTAGEHDDHLGKSINSANKHLTYQYSKSEAFSPNTGKDNYVAEMTIDSASQVYLYIYQVEGGNKRYVRSKFVCDASKSGGDANDKTNIIYNWEYDAMYDIAAGDMDGDGYDEIAVYAQNKVYVYSFKGGTLSSSPIATHDVTPPTGTSDDAGYKKLKTAVVTLAFGDLNADDKDELVIAENIGYGATNIDTGKVGIYRLETNESTKKNTLVKAMKDDILLAVPGSSGIFNAGPMVRYANVATGDIDGDYQDELVIAGYISSKIPNATCNRGDIAYMIVKGGSDNQFTHSDWKAVDKNKNRIDLLDRVVDNNNQLIPPVALTCAATQGVGYAEQVFLGGYLYSVTGANEQKTNVENYSLNALTRISTNREYKKDNGNKANKEEIFVVNVVAGNFNGNRNGQEQIVYAFGMKHDDSDRYWYDIGYINKKEPGDTHANESSGYWYGQEQVMNYESSYNRDSSKARASLYLSLAAVDCDNDSTLMRYKGQTVTWTKPEVLTILQSAPYFQDLQDTRDYINQGQTGYGKGSSSSSSAIAGTSLKVGTYVSFEQDFSVFGVKVASIEAEAQSTHEFEYEFQSTKEKSIEVRYSGSAGDDYAVVYAVPYMEYQYETWVPGYTLQGGNYVKYLNTYLSQKLGKPESEITDEQRDKAAKELGITQNTTVEGSWQPSSVMVPMKPATVLITVDDYDEIAEQTEGLEPIRGNILNSTPGEPATYDKINSRSGSFNKIGAQQSVTTAEGGNVSLEATSTDTTEHTFAYNYEFEAKAGAGAGGVTVGVLAGLGTTAGGGISSSQSNSYSATVDNLPKDASQYGFSWQFGWRNAKLNNNDVLVLEYQLDGVKQLPSMPKNLRVDSVTSNSVTLKWDPVVGAGAYKIYQASTTGDNKKYCIATVPGTATSYTDTSVNPNNIYTYCVQNVSQVGGESIYSTDVRAITLTDANGNFVIKQQPEDLTTYVGGTATTTVEAEYLKNGQSQGLRYYWERYNTKTKKWDNYSDGSPQLSVSVTKDTVDGTKYRCLVFYNANLYLYTDPVTLTIGKAKSTTQLGTSVQSGATVNASYVKKEPKNTGVMDDVPVKVTIENKTYTKYTKGDVEVYLDEDGNYYSISGETATQLTKQTEPSALTYNTVSDSDTIIVNSVLYGSLTIDNSYSKETNPITYEYTDEDEKQITYKADEKYSTGATDLTAYKCSIPKTETEEAYDFWFVVIGTNQYAANLETKTTVTVGDKHIPIDELTLATEQKETETVEETYKEGDTVTLTATPSDPSQSGLKLSGKVVFKIVNSIGDGSKTLDAVIGEDGTATAEWIPTAAGVYTITAEYEGNEKYMGSVSSQTITINVVVPEQKTLMIDSKNSMTYGDAAIELKTTLLDGQSATKQATTLTSGVTYSVKNADGTEVSTGSTFDPTAAGTYTVTATYTSGSETLTATKSIVVNKRTVTIVPKVTGTGTSKAATYSLKNCVSGDETLFNGKITVTCAGTEPNAVAGEYPYTVTYTPGDNEAAINSKYIVVIDTMHPYVLKDDMVTVTDKTSSNNGTVTLRYRSSSTDSYVDVYGDSVPKNAEVIAVASPKAGYRVKQWKVDEQAVTTGEGGTLNTAQTITVAQSATTNHTVEAEFELVYHTLSFEVTDGSKQTGTVTAKYLKDSVESGTFVSGKRVSYFDRVQLTAKVNDGLSIKEWRITRNNGTPETLKIENEVYTGNSYVLSSITADTKVTVVTENQTACTVNIHLVNTNGEPLTRGQVAFNGATQEANPQGTFTYYGHKNDNLTVALTLPSGLVVDEWLRKDDETNTSSALQIGSFSNNKTTWNIVNLPTSLDLTVKCSTPNSYTITKSTIVQSGTEDETGGTIEVYQIGREDQVNAVLQGSDLLVKVNPVNGYQLLDVTCNDTSQMSQMGSGNEFRINGVNENTNIVATFVKKPVVTFTAGSKGTIEVSNGPSVSGGTVPYGYKNDIVFTAKPDPGYEVDSWTVTGVTDPQGTSVANSDNQTYTYTPNAETGITGDLTVTVSFKALPKATVEFSVVDKNNETDGGFDGTIQATVTRNGQSTTSNKVTSDTLTNVYRDSKVTFAAEPAAGYKVTKWLVGNREQPTPPVLDIVEGDDGTTKTVQVQFEKISDKIIYAIDENSDAGHGATLDVTFLASSSTKPDSVTSGNSVRGPGVLTATVNDLNDGYEIESWILNGAPYTPDENGKLTCNVSETQGADIKVKIVRKSYQITFSATEGGTITAQEGVNALTSPASVKGDKQVTFTASQPQTGYEFVGWNVDGTTVPDNTSSTYTLDVSKDTTVQARYALTTAKYQVTYGIIQTGGQNNGTLAVSGLDRSGKANAGSNITFTATPAEGYQVKQWYNAATSGTEIGAAESTTYEIENLTANASVYVQFEPIPTYNITVNVSGQGSVTAMVNEKPATITNNTLEVKRHDFVVLTAEPEEGHHLKEWTGGTASQANPLTLTLSDVTAPHAITANFEVNQGVPFQTICGTGGSLEAKAGYGNNLQPIKADTGIQVDNGKKIVLTAKPDNDKAVVWTVNNQPTNELSNTYTIDAISENTTVKANFVTLELCTIPTDMSNDTYSISSVTKYPADYGDANQIRKGGTLSFKLTPKKPVMGLQGLPENAKVVYNSDGSYTVTVTNVTSDISFQMKEYQAKTEDLQVPSGYTEDTLKSALRTQISSSVSRSNIQYLDITLKMKNSSGEWVNIVNPEDFPKGGVYVTISYPNGTDKQDTFYISHMLTVDMNGKKAGEVEEITPITKGENGISFHVTSLSPFAIGWTKYVAPTPGGGGGGGGAVSTYTLTFDTNGGSAIDKITKDSGTTIDLAAYKPTRAGYTFAGWFSDKALTKTVTSVKLTANTTVYAKWTQNGGTAENPFVDVKKGAYYYDAVLWAVEQKITSGTSATTFSPDASCTRAQMVTFLWRAAGSPKVENGKNPFADVKADAYYYDAVLWAVEKGVTSGTSATTFSPDATVTRGQTVTFLYRNAGSPEVSGTMPFTDVEADAYYAKAVQWAVQQKITTGTSETTFSPMSDCTRGQIVTFLYRAK